MAFGRRRNVPRLSLYGRPSPLDRCPHAPLHLDEDKRTAVSLRQAFGEQGLPLSNSAPDLRSKVAAVDETMGPSS